MSNVESFDSSTGDRPFLRWLGWQVIKILSNANVFCPVQEYILAVSQDELSATDRADLEYVYSSKELCVSDII